MKKFISIFLAMIVTLTVNFSAAGEFTSKKFGEMTKTDPVAAIQWAARSGISWDAFTVVLKEQGVPEDRVGDMKKIFDAAKPVPEPPAVVAPAPPTVVSPAPAPATVVPVEVTLRERLQLKYGVAEEVEGPTYEHPTIVWATGPDGWMLPVFLRSDNRWSILTGDLNPSGTPVPPAIASLPSGKGWQKITEPYVFRAPDGKNVPTGGALKDKVLLFGAR